jgi:hypothetical protein
MIIPEPAQDSQSCLWSFGRLIEQSVLYAGEVDYVTRDDLGMVIGSVNLIYFSPLALFDMKRYVGNNN